jgi:hypothetical protein
VFFGIDAARGENAAEKANLILTLPPVSLNQEQQRQVPDSRVIIGELGEGSPLEDLCDCYYGLCSGDSPRFLSGFWELPKSDKNWTFLQDAVSNTITFGGMERIFLWEAGKGQYYKFICERLGEEGIYAWIRGGEAWGKRGISISRMGDLACSIYCGELFDQNVAVIVPKNEKHLAPLWSFLSSQDFVKQVRVLDQKLSVTPRTMKQVAFDLANWQKVAVEKYPNGLPQPFSSDATQWLFNGHPKGAENPLQVAVARLLGYRWPRQTGSNFPDCPALEPDGLEPFADDDGIVCIPAAGQEQPAENRLRALLAAAFGAEWSATKEGELLAQAGYAGKSMEDWLRNGFAEQHGKLFQQRPFVWHLWDGRKDGFSALVNYHKLDRALLDKLIYTYLGDWITRQESGVQSGEGGSDARLTAARDLQRRLKLIAEGEPPFDIFVRWKPLAQQPIGWEPDLNDGVRLNIRPFVEAGVLRKDPNVNWKKDRGADPASAPWFKVFNGDRINDHHLTLAEKRAARQAKEIL